MAVTLAQLRGEPWWDREIVTPEMAELGRALCAAFGRPVSAFGVKGDAAHRNGAHRSQEWIQRSRFCTSRTYTVQAGLGGEALRWCAGLDFNPGSTERMLLICRRLDVAVRAGVLEEVIEWFGNLNGDQRVDGWNNIRNTAASADSSHLWHLHLSIDRRHARNPAVMDKIRRVLLGQPLAAATNPPPSVEDDMPTLLTAAVPSGFAADVDGNIIDPGRLLVLPVPAGVKAGLPWGAIYASASVDGGGPVKLRVAWHDGTAWRVGGVVVDAGKGRVQLPHHGDDGLPVATPAAGTLSVGRMPLQAGDTADSTPCTVLVECGAR